MKCCEMCAVLLCSLLLRGFSLVAQLGIPPAPHSHRSWVLSLSGKCLHQWRRRGSDDLSRRATPAPPAQSPARGTFRDPQCLKRWSALGHPVQRTPPETLSPHPHHQPHVRPCAALRHATPRRATSPVPKQASMTLQPSTN